MLSGLKSSANVRSRIFSGHDPELWASLPKAPAEIV
jgi:hypothetical protein